MYAFELLFLAGGELRAKPLGDRREALGLLMRPSSAVAFSDEYTGSGVDLFRVAWLDNAEQNARDFSVYPMRDLYLRCSDSRGTCFTHRPTTLTT
jgi:hypothetical protein